MSDPSASHLDLSGDDDDGPMTDPTDADLAAARAEPSAPAGTALEDIVAELEQDIAADAARFDIDGRDGWVAVYRKDFDGADIESWRKAAKPRGKKEPDPVRFAGIIVSRTMTSIERGGVTIEDPDEGGPATVRSPWLQGIYGVESAIECARKLFGGDGFLVTQGNGVLERAGWAAEASDAADPT